MGDPQHLWINSANAVLGIVVLFLLLATLVAVVAEIVTHFKRRFELRAELDHDLRELDQLASRR
jgi:uncharacterized membrane protein